MKTLVIFVLLCFCSCRDTRTPEEQFCGSAEYLSNEYTEKLTQCRIESCSQWFRNQLDEFNRRCK